MAGFDTIVRSNIIATPPTNSEPDPDGLPANTRYYRILVEP